MCRELASQSRDPFGTLPQTATDSHKQSLPAPAAKCETHGRPHQRPQRSRSDHPDDRQPVTCSRIQRGRHQSGRPRHRSANRLQRHREEYEPQPVLVEEARYLVRAHGELVSRTVVSDRQPSALMRAISC